MGSLTKLPFREVAFRVSTDFLEHLLANYPRNDFQVRLWDGRTWGADEPRFTLVLKHPGALRAMFLSPSELTLGEAYVYDDLDIEGDIEAAFDLADYLLGQGPSLGESLGLGERLQKLPADNRPHRDRQTANFWGSVHSRERDRQAISYHYDLPAEFYSLWLDRHMVYSCAYFATLEEDLDIAQERKLDHICKKLRLRRGDHLLDIGCGWGALIMHAAADYGVDAVGITLSAPQAELARRRICESGLNDRCRVEVWDYRDLDPSRQYDKIVSVGMFEHVGEALLPEYFRRARDLLRPGGVFLNHGIAYSAIYHRRGPSFTDRYVFVAVTGTRRLGFVLPVYPSQLRGCRQGTAPIKSRQLMTFHLLHGWNGTGRTMAVASAFDFEDSDLQTFDATFGITLNGYARVFVKTGSVQGLGNGGETTLDVEYSTALGNGAFELIYLVNNLLQFHDRVQSNRH